MTDPIRAALSADGPAVPEDREPASVVREPSDAELLELMHQSMRDDLAEVSRLAALKAGTDPGVFRVTLNHDVARFARAVLARYGHQPAPPAEGEVGELVAWIRGMYWAHPDKERATRAAELLAQRHPAPVPVAERRISCWPRLPELRGMFERILCVARSSGQRPVGHIELADRLISAVVSWAALPLPAGEVEP